MTMQNEQAAAEAVRTAAEVFNQDGVTFMRLRNGIELRIHTVPPLYLSALAENFTPPDPPKRRIEQEGAEPFDEENPNDPEYQRTLDRLDRQYIAAKTRLYYGYGTTVEKVPDSLYGPEQDGWIERVRAYEALTGSTVPLVLDDKTERYICWLRYYAVDNNSDAVALVRILEEASLGVTREEVDRHMATFRRLGSRAADTQGSAEPAGSNGNPNRATRRRGSK